MDITSDDSYMQQALLKDEVISDQLQMKVKSH